MTINEHPVQTFDSIEGLLAGVTDREPLVSTDGKSGNWLERVWIGGRPHVVKHQAMGEDWIMRITGDRIFWPYILLRDGILDRVPACIDHAVVGMAMGGDPPGSRLAILMRDVGDRLIPEGDDPVTEADHEGLLTDMAALHATFWGWTDDLALQTMRQRLLSFSPRNIAPEVARADVAVPIEVAAQGWAMLPRVAPALHRIVTELHDDPQPLLDALATTPVSFVHGDWKMGNLGRHADGRTILLDWAYPGSAPPCWDLMWYLALNRSRLPQSKEQSIEVYRRALEANGIDTGPWWDRQLGLSFVAIMVLFAWEKAVGDTEELSWWEDRVQAGMAWLTATPEVSATREDG